MNTACLRPAGLRSLVLGCGLCLLSLLSAPIGLEAADALAQTQTQASASASYRRGMALYVAKNWPAAAAEFEAALKAMPGYYYAFKPLGYCRNNMKQTREAVALLKQHLQYKPDDLATRKYVADLEAWLSRQDMAREAQAAAPTAVPTAVAAAPGAEPGAKKDTRLYKMELGLWASLASPSLAAVNTALGKESNTSSQPGLTLDPKLNALNSETSFGLSVGYTLFMPAPDLYIGAGLGGGYHPVNEGGWKTTGTGPAGEAWLSEAKLNLGYIPIEFGLWAERRMRSFHVRASLYAGPAFSFLRYSLVEKLSQPSFSDSGQTLGFNCTGDVAAAYDLMLDIGFSPLKDLALFAGVGYQGLNVPAMRFESSVDMDGDGDVDDPWDLKKGEALKDSEDRVMTWDLSGMFTRFGVRMRIE